MTPENRRIGLRIKALRLERKLDQTELAQKLGLKKDSISRYERGLNLPALKGLSKIARFFGMTVTELLRDEPTDREVRDALERAEKRLTELERHFRDLDARLQDRKPNH